MKKLFITFFLIYVGLVAHAYADSKEKPAVDDGKLTIAVIDVQAISRKATAMKSIQKQLESLRASYQGQISKEQDVLRKAEKEIGAVRDELPKEELAKRSKKFAQQAAELQSRVGKSKRNLERAYTDATRKFQAELVKQVSEYAESKKIDIVMRRSQVFLAEKALDITPIILERVNKAIPDIKVTTPKSS